MEEKKYVLLENDKMEKYGRTLYRIKALKDFCDVKAGDFGGYIEKEENLSHHGECWVYNCANVFDDAYVSGDASISQSASVYQKAKIDGYARVYGKAEVYGYAHVYEYAEVYDNARVYDKAVIYGDAEVFGNATIYQDAIVFDHAWVYGESYVSQNISVSGESRITGDVELIGDARIINAHITSNSDYLIIGSGEELFTFYKTKFGFLVCNYGDFSGNITDFKKFDEYKNNDKYFEKILELVYTYFD